MAAMGWWEKSRIHQALRRLVAGSGISVDSSNASVPVVSAKISTDASNALSFGTDDGLFATGGGGGGTSEGSIDMVFGAEPSASAAILPTQTRTFPIPANYNLTGWQISVDPAATVSLDVRVTAFPTTPSSGDSITAGHPITTSAAVSNTGVTTSWGTTAIARGAYMQIAITANDVATRIALTLLGDKS